MTLRLTAVLTLACLAPRLAAQEHPVVAGPVATQTLQEEIAAQDRHLFETVFVRCDADALAGLLADDFEFYHDKFGQVAATPQQFVDNVRKGCAAQAAGQNVRARRELVDGSMAVYPVNNYGAIQTGSHRFFGVEAGKPDKLREIGKFFHLWRNSAGRWKLARVFSYDHRPGD